MSYDENKHHWQEENDAARKRDVDFETLSGEPLKPLYDPSDVADIDVEFPRINLVHLAGRNAPISTALTRRAVCRSWST